MAENKGSKEKQNVDIRKDRRFAGALKQLRNISSQSNLSLYGTDRESKVDDLDAKFQSIMKKELHSISGTGEGDPNSLLTKLWDSDKKGNAYRNLMDSQFMNISMDESSVMANFVQEMYRNRYTAQNDLHEVSSALIELSEAIDITRDAIVSADVVEGRMSRTLNFEVNSDETEDDLLPIVEKMEEKFDLQTKIKNFIIPMTLEYGEYYAYVIPYSELFSQFSETQSKYGSSRTYRESYEGKTVLESVMDQTIRTNKMKNTSTPKYSSVASKIYSVYKESVEKQSKVSPNKAKTSNVITEEAFVSDIDDLLDRVTISNDIIPLPLLESGAGAFEAFRDEYEGKPFTEAYKIQKDKKEINRFNQVVTGVSSEGIKFSGGNKNNANTDGTIKSDFSDISDCYIKLYDPTKIVPVKIMNKTIGYYIILTNSNVAPLNGAVSNTLFYTDVDDTRRCERTIVDQLADTIVSSFNKEFLKDNLEFKELIVEAITHYNLNENRIKFQFVPVKYIQEFKIDEDVDGNGQSMIKKSLFYAKLYLMLLLFKIMTIIQNSNDTKVNYIRSSGIDKDLANKVQEIARRKQSRQINMADLFNYTTLINKVGMGSEMYVPTGRSNERPMETEILAGQDVQLDTPLLENLKNSYILGTGVPAAILNYLHEADFSRTQELNNTKFNGRVVNYQIDFNRSITNFYKRIMKYSTNISQEYIDGFTFTLQPPKSAATTVKNEAINNFTSVADFVALMYFGDNQDQNPKVTKQIAIFKRKFAEEQLPMLNWKRLDDIVKEAKIDAEEDALTPNPDNGDNGDDIGLDLDGLT